MTRLFAVAATLFVVAALIAQRDVIVKLRAENEKMHTENEKMHTALYRIAAQGPFADDPWTIARNALEGKP